MRSTFPLFVAESIRENGQASEAPSGPTESEALIERLFTSPQSGAKEAPQ